VSVTKTVKDDMLKLIEEIKKYENTDNSNTYMTYLWKYYYFPTAEKKTSYTRAYRELKTRVLNLRMTQVKKLEYALSFNILLLEFKYFAGRKDNANVDIEAATAYDTWVAT